MVLNSDDILKKVLKANKTLHQSHSHHQLSSVNNPPSPVTQEIPASASAPAVSPVSNNNSYQNNPNSSMRLFGSASPPTDDSSIQNIKQSDSKSSISRIEKKNDEEKGKVLKENDEKTSSSIEQNDRYAKARGESAREDKKYYDYDRRRENTESDNVRSRSRDGREDRSSRREHSRREPSRDDDYDRYRDDRRKNRRRSRSRSRSRHSRRKDDDDYYREMDYVGDRRKSRDEGGRYRSRSRNYREDSVSSSRGRGYHHHNDRDRHGFRSRSRSRDRRPSKRTHPSSISHPPPSNSGRGKLTLVERPDGTKEYVRSGADEYSRRNSRDRTPPPPAKRTPAEELAALDRTVCVMRLPPKVTDRDLREFFLREKIGEVISAKIVRDHKTRVSKGIGYVEFEDAESIPKALKLSGNQIGGGSIVIQKTEQEKQLLMHQIANGGFGHTSQQSKDQNSRKLFLSNISPALTLANLQSIFAEFGEIESFELQKDSNGASKGIAFLTYTKPLDARRAMDTMNKYVLVGKPIQITYVQEKTTEQQTISINNDFGDGEENLQKVSRTELMMRLSRSDPTLMTASNSPIAQPGTSSNKLIEYSSTPTRNCLLANMFDPAEESGDNWDEEIKEDVLSECSKFGVIVFINVDKLNPKGHVYMRFDSIESCRKCSEALNGRWFAKRQISALYIDDSDFEAKFAKEL